MELALFALNSSREFGEAVAGDLKQPLKEHIERNFEDGEHKTRTLQSVRGKDVYVVHSIYSDSEERVNEKLVRLLFFTGALKDAAAERVTAVVPYLCYARKDRKTKPRDPVTTRYLAQLFEVVGTDCLITVDVHNLAAFQNAARCRTEHLEARPLFVDHFASRLSNKEITVISPDIGGLKRAAKFRDSLSQALDRHIPTAFMMKKRSRGKVTTEEVVGNVNGRTAIIIDDLISTGTTMARAARSCREQGVETVFAAATHGLFTEGSEEVVEDPAIDQFFITSSVPPFRLPKELVQKKVTVLDIAPLFAESIRRLHEGGSIIELLREPE